MKNTKIVYLPAVRHLLTELDVIRQHVLKGEVTGWMGVLRDEQNRDTLYVGGVYGKSSEDRLGAVLKMSTARVEIADGLTGTNC